MGRGGKLDLVKRSASTLTQYVCRKKRLWHRDINRLPVSILEATEKLERDTVLTDTMGTMLADSCLAIRQADWKIFSGESYEFEIRNHSYKD